MKAKINFKTFTELSDQVEIKLGEITSVEKMDKSDKMLKLQVSFGENDVRTVMTNIGNKVDSSELLNAIYPFITNLESAKIMGVESNAMIMVPTTNGAIDLIGEPGSVLM